MPYTVLIRRSSDGEVRRYPEDHDWDGSWEFYWTDGNMGCDCNRHAAFEAAGRGQKMNTLSDEHECGQTAYSVPAVILPDGTRINLDESR